LRYPADLRLNCSSSSEKDLSKEIEVVLPVLVVELAPPVLVVELAEAVRSMPEGVGYGS
jgi:hypothetical protein